MRHIRSITGTTLIFSFLLGLLPMPLRAQSAPALKPVVINEIAWAGTAASGNDEWIELFNNTDADVSLAGWSINDDNGAQIYPIPSGVVRAHSYFLIEDTEATTSTTADAIINLSLANSGDSLVLLDANGQTIDTVNGSGGAWYAGQSSTYASMELRDPQTSTDASAEWTSNTLSNGATDRNGGVIAGTPRSENSTLQVPPTPAHVSLTASTASPINGQTVSVTAHITDATSLFSYGLDASYDPSVLEFTTVTNGGFLSAEGRVETSFETGLENSAPGKVVIAESRLYPQIEGVSGNGDLFQITFRVIGTAGSASDISIASNSANFLAGPAQDQLAAFSPASVSVRMAVAEPAQNFAAALGLNRYEIALSWSAPAGGAERYRVLRRAASGEFVEIGNTASLSFADSDSAANGGKIIPNLAYEYEVIAMRNGVESTPVSVQATETRGIKGDNNRSDRVDGRDLQRLAQHFTQTTADANFELLIDTTYDGRIDGSDLIDLASNWAVTYQ